MKIRQIEVKIGLRGFITEWKYNRIIGIRFISNYYAKSKIAKIVQRVNNIL